MIEEQIKLFYYDKMMTFEFTLETMTICFKKLLPLLYSSL
jgi:hypothetical protein